jgi:hypothetical protein
MQRTCERVLYRSKVICGESAAGDGLAQRSVLVVDRDTSGCRRCTHADSGAFLERRAGDVRVIEARRVYAVHHCTTHTHARKSQTHAGTSMVDSVRYGYHHTCNTQVSTHEPIADADDTARKKTTRLQIATPVLTTHWVCVAEVLLLREPRACPESARSSQHNRS